MDVEKVQMGGLHRKRMKDINSEYDEKLGIIFFRNTLDDLEVGDK